MRPPRTRKSPPPSSITITCRLFGRYADALGVDTVELELPPSSSALDAVAKVRARLHNPAHLPERPLVAINQEHVPSDTRLKDGDEIAILPPLAGG